MVDLESRQPQGPNRDCAAQMYRSRLREPPLAAHRAIRLRQDYPRRSGSRRHEDACALLGRVGDNPDDGVGAVTKNGAGEGWRTPCRPPIADGLHDTLLRRERSGLAVVRSWNITLFLEDMRPRCSAHARSIMIPARQRLTASEGIRMDARTVWFRETGEGETKEQLLIETMFCVYYLSKGSAVLVTRALQSHSFFGTSSPPEPPWPVLLSELRFWKSKGRKGRSRWCVSTAATG